MTTVGAPWRNSSCARWRADKAPRVPARSHFQAKVPDERAYRGQRLGLLVALQSRPPFGQYQNQRAAPGQRRSQLRDDLGEGRARELGDPSGSLLLWVEKRIPTTAQRLTHGVEEHRVLTHARDAGAYGGGRRLGVEADRCARAHGHNPRRHLRCDSAELRLCLVVSAIVKTDSFLPRFSDEGESPRTIRTECERAHIGACAGGHHRGRTGAFVPLSEAAPGPVACCWSEPQAAGQAGTEQLGGAG